MSGGSAVIALPMIEDDEEPTIVSNDKVSKEKANIPTAYESELYPDSSESPAKKPNERVDTIGPEPLSEAEVAARGFGQGMFGLGDEVVAAFKSLAPGTTYKQEFEKQQAFEEQAQKQSPWTYYGAMGVGGAASFAIPGIGAIARTEQAVNAARGLKTAKDVLQAAKTAGDAVKITEATTALNAARSALTKELIRGGAQAGALTGAGASKATIAENPVDVAADALVGGVIGGITNVAIPRAAEKFAESKVGKPIVEAAGKGFEKVKEIGRKAWEGERWQLFPNRPDLQRTVDQMVSEGQAAGLTDNQILTNLKTQFSGQLTNADFEAAFKEKGLAGRLKRAVAGSQEAAEFLNRPEQFTRAEALTKGKSPEMQTLEEGISLGEKGITGLSREKQALKEKTGEDINTIKQKLKDLTDQYKTEDNEAAKIQIEKDIAYNKELLRLNTGIDQRRRNLADLEKINKQNQDTVKAELDKLEKTKSNEQLTKVAKLRDELNGQVQELSQQRNSLINTLDDPELYPATDEQLKAYRTVKSMLRAQAQEAGMSQEWKNIENIAFGDDVRIANVEKTIKYRDDLEKWQKAYDDTRYNLINGLNPGDARYRPVNKADRSLFLPNGELKDKPTLPINPLMDYAKSASGKSKSEATQGDIVAALMTANKRISSAAYGTPIANIKKQVAETIQEQMSKVNKDVYALQRQIADTTANVKTLERSPFFETKFIPVTGKTGRTATAPKKFIKTELPDFSKQSPDYKNILSEIGVDIEGVDKAISKEMRDRILSQAGGEVTPLIAKGQKDIAQKERELQTLKAMRLEMENQSKLAEKEVITKREAEKAGYRRQVIKQRQEIKPKIKDINQRIMQIEDELTGLREQKGRLGETESQLTKMYKETEGIPVSGRDIAQAGTIAAQGVVPWVAGKLLPSPKTRIQVVNKIKNRFANPSLTAAVRGLLDQPITRDAITRLSEMHSVSEPELLKTLIESGVPVEQE